MAFRWQANVGPLIVVLGFFFPSSPKKPPKDPALKYKQMKKGMTESRLERVGGGYHKKYSLIMHPYLDVCMVIVGIEQEAICDGESQQLINNNY